MEMKTARSHHTATLLPDGRVLVTGGGTENDGETNSVELYNPSTETWASTSPLHIGRKYHTAIRLHDGRVLVAGGRTGTGVHHRTLSSVEIYDPSTGTWIITGRLTFAREWHAAILLADGRVLVAGGMAKKKGRLKSAEIYNPSTGTWSITGMLNNTSTFHTAVRLMNGKALMTGDAANKRTELYDPSTGRWSNTGRQRWARRLHTATLLKNGKVLLAGGRKIHQYIDGAEVYTPNAGTWTSAGRINSVRRSHTATLLADGRVLIAGGGEDNGVQKSVEFYDPVTNTWTVGGAMNKPRLGHSATRLKNGMVLIAGGVRKGGRREKSTELYIPDHMESTLKIMLKEQASNVRTELRKKKVYGRMRLLHNGIEVGLRRSDERDVAADAISDLLHADFDIDTSERGDDYLVTATFKAQSLREANKFTLEQNMTTLRNKVNQLGVTKPITGGHPSPNAAPSPPKQKMQLPAATNTVSHKRSPQPPMQSGQDRADAPKKIVDIPKGADNGSMEHQAIKSATITVLAELKAKADIFSETLAELPAGTKVVVNAIEGDWALVSANDQQGYVYVEYLSRKHDRDEIQQSKNNSIIPNEEKQNGTKNYDKYISRIRSKIVRNWRKPPGTRSGLKAKMRVKLFPGGAVASVNILQSSGNSTFDQSATEAVQKASPLPVPRGTGFDRFRVLNLQLQ